MNRSLYETAHETTDGKILKSTKQRKDEKPQKSLRTAESDLSRIFVSRYHCNCADMEEDAEH